MSSQLSFWKTRIETGDAQALWQSLHRLVSVHPLVRSALRSQQFSSAATPFFSVRDLTQDLYLLLLQKGRFEHYFSAEMTDVEIEREIFQIELTNLLIGHLRRNRPENYRMVRRISGVLESDPRFSLFKRREGQTSRYRQAAEAVYGLREWAEEKALKDCGTFGELIAGISMRMRNRKRAGCTGEAQVIVTNQELTELLVEIFEAIDSPAPLRVLRQLALSKLPVSDPSITAIEDDADDEQPGYSVYQSIPSSEPSPEQVVLRREREAQIRCVAARFLDQLRLLVRSNPRRTERLWRVLWHCFFDPEEPSQLEIAEMIGISDSSVSDYRRKLEAEMRKLGLALEHLRCFAEELEEQLRSCLSISDRKPGPMLWPRYEFGSLGPDLRV
ncbi:MAG TPA: hypothetical protein VJ302_33110 [Blastocatellia bacterium]|nr:hypothetical protein [Blastocatellia bacterium]